MSLRRLLLRVRFFSLTRVAACTSHSFYSITPLLLVLLVCHLVLMRYGRALPMQSLESVLVPPGAPSLGDKNI